MVKRAKQKIMSKTKHADISTTLKTAIGYHQAGQLQKAEHSYKKILSVNPNHADALNLLGVISCQTSHHAQGIPLFKKAILQNPEQASYHYNLGNALKDLGKSKESIPYYRQAFKLRPNYPEAFHNLGITLQNLGQLEEASDCYQQAIQLKSDYPEAYYNLARILENQGQLEEAISSYQQALQLKPDFAEVYYSLGNIFKDHERPEDAVLCYRNALKYQPNYAEALNNLGGLLNQLRLLDEAVTCYQLALQLKPDDASLHYNLASTLKDRGNNEEAIAAFHQALKLEPEFAASHNNMGISYTNLKHFPEAVACYRQALQIKPDYAEAHGNLAYAYSRVGELDAAIASCRQALSINPEIEKVYMLWASLLLLTADKPQFEQNTSTFLANKNISEPNRNWLYIQKAVIAWADGDAEGCQECLQKAVSVKYKKPSGKFEISRLAYYTLLTRLVDFRNKHQEMYDKNNLPPVHIIGDSHSLCFAGTSVLLDNIPHQVTAKPIIGCKAYHLSKKEHNRFKEAFIRQIDSIPSNSTILLSIGEIDCRTNEGIYDVWKKKYHDNSIEPIISKVIKGYVHFVLQATTKKNFHIIICGIPAPMKCRANHLAVAELTGYAAVPKLFNKLLQKEASENGLAFLDLHGLTSGQDNYSHSYYHLDDVHLKPSALELAFKSKFIKK